MAEKPFGVRYPWMFDHPEIQPGEVWLRDELLEYVHPSIDMYRNSGVSSARTGWSRVVVTRIDGEYEGRSIFVRLNELLEVAGRGKKP